MPVPFEIPTFRKDTEKNLKNKIRTESDRKYIVRTLSTMLMTYVQRPSIDDADVPARYLVKRWPFLKDETGDGQVHVTLHVY